MKYILIMSLFMAGCSKTPTNDQYKDSQNWCDQFGGVKTSQFSPAKGLRVWCIDGTVIIKRFK